MCEKRLDFPSLIFWYFLIWRNVISCRLLPAVWSGKVHFCETLISRPWHVRYELWWSPSDNPWSFMKTVWGGCWKQGWGACQWDETYTAGSPNPLHHLTTSASAASASERHRTLLENRTCCSEKEDLLHCLYCICGKTVLGDAFRWLVG